jgi:predicted peptidase
MNPLPLFTRRTVLATPLLMTACAQTPPSNPLPTLPGQHAVAIDVPGRSAPVRSWLYMPPGYAASTQAWPLVLFLHGSGERGTALDKVKVHGPPKHAAAGRHYPFILCSPQLEEGQDWRVDTLHALRLALQARLRVDPQRITATGLSLGGHGVWAWAAAYPGDLAAIAPVCGWGDPATVCQAKHVPVRAYHGSLDDAVPMASQQVCVDALRACGGQAEFIVYPGVGHNAWDRAYEDAALVPWLMAQKSLAAGR